jgi:hypothetical protein
LIRSQHNRNLAEGGRLWASIEACAAAGKITFHLPGRGDQKARQLKQQRTGPGGR